MQTTSPSPWLIVGLAYAEEGWHMLENFPWEKYGIAVRTVSNTFARRVPRHQYIALLTATGVGVTAGWIFLLQLPDIRNEAAWNPPRSIAVTDRSGKDMYFAYAGEDRIWVDDERIPDIVKHAFIATEDRRFWTRGCIDHRALGRAVLANMTSYKSQGASTITQQLVRTALLTRTKTLSRKAEEMVLACKLEKIMSKEDILEHYLNWISFGGVTAGVQQASRQFFNKDVSELTLAQAAVLASLPQRPTYFSPYGPNIQTRLTPRGAALLGSGTSLENFEASQENVTLGLIGTTVSLPGRSSELLIGGRAHQVLSHMLAQGYIDAATKAKADQDLLRIRFRPNVRALTAPHYVLGVLRSLEQTLPETAYRSQLSVETTIDPDLQQTAERLAREHGAKIMEQYNAHNVALILADLHTREILAYVGNADFFGSASGARIDMAVAPRQPGSSFKPIVYATTMQEKQWKPYTIVADSPLVIGGARPRNYAGNFEGNMTVMNALNHSRNIPAIRAFNAVGEDPILHIAAALGAPTPLERRERLRKNGTPFDYNWPLSIGAAEVPLVEMVQAYATLGNSGVFKPLTGLRAVHDASGTSYLPKASSGSQAIAAHIADTLTAMLSEKKSRPAGWWQSMTDVPGMDEAVKTGTSNVCLERTKTRCVKMLPRDVWALGYTPAFIVGVWVGNVDGSPMTAKADGLNVAVPLWKEMLLAAHAHPLGKNVPLAFSGTRAPYYTQFPIVNPAFRDAPGEAPSWIGGVMGRNILTRRE